jgi:hypothetical protein
VEEPEQPDEALKRAETGEFKRVDLTTRDRVTAIQAKWESSLRRMWVAILGLYIVACVGGFFLWQNSHAIQKSRIQATYQTCQESNDRHDRTVAAFNREFERLPRGQRREDQRLANIRLINVFIPVHKDSAGRSTCLEFARGRVNVDG